MTSVAEFPAPVVREPRLKLVHFADIQPRHSGPGIISGLLNPGEMSIMHGPPGCRKTFLAIDLMMHVATGEPWRGRSVTPGPCVYLAAEAGASIFNRFAAQKIQRGLEDAAIPLAVVPSPIDLCSQPNPDMAVLRELLAVAQEGFEAPIRLIVLDTLSRAMAGGDENSSVDMGAMVRHMDMIRAETGAHVMIIHHSGKDVARGARGHSLLFGAVDTAIDIQPDEAGGFSVAKVYKQRDLPSDGAFPFGLEVVEIGKGDDGEPMTSCVVRHLDEENAKIGKPVKLNPAAKLAIDSLHNCLIASGEPAPPFEQIPRGVICVTKTAWKTRLQCDGVIGTENGHREQLRRIIVTLKNAGLIGVWDEWIWSVTKRHRASQ